MRLQSSPEVVGVDEVGKMLFQLCVIVVVEALDSGFLDGPVHPLDLSVGPGVLHLRQTMLNAVTGNASPDWLWAFVSTITSFANRTEHTRSYEPRMA